MDGAAGAASSLGSKLKKGLTAAAKVSAAALSAAATGVAVLTKAAIENYAEYEQLIGGVETLFKQSAGIVEAYANNAFKTAGMSANEYMSTVTSFSASLLQSVGGDTEKAARIADMAITDMSDNANKMGSSMEMIQNAYQGFAKQNYTMLDNLKLGYGGTKQEMERLRKDAEKLSGQKYDISNLNDVFEAIHVIQTELGVTGTTAKEAASTIQGSVAMMKAAWQNMLTGIADDTQDFDVLVSNLVESVVTVADNVVPRVQQALTGIGKLIEGLAPILGEQLPVMIASLLPSLISAASSLLNSLLAALPELLSTLDQVIPILIDAIMTSLPLVLNAAIDILLALAEGITSNLPTLIPTVVSVTMQIVQTLIDNIPLLIDAGLDMLIALGKGILSAIPQLTGMLPEVITSIVATLIDQLPNIIATGTELLLALVEGILSAVPELVAMLPEIIETTVTTLVEQLPQIVKTGVKLLTELIAGIVSAIPTLIDMLPTIIDTIVTVLLNNLPLIIDAGFQILIGVIDGILNAIPQLVAMLPKIITTIVQVITKNLPQILRMGVEIIKSLINGIGSMISSLTSKAGQLVTAIVKKIGELPSKMLSIGKNIVQGVWNGISNATSWIKNKISGWVGNVTSFLKRLFGIASPSKVMRDEVGKFIAEGVGLGFELQMPKELEAMEKAANIDGFINSIDHAVASAGGGTANRAAHPVATASQRDIVLQIDGRELARFLAPNMSAQLAFGG